MIPILDIHALIDKANASLPPNTYIRRFWLELELRQRPVFILGLEVVQEGEVYRVKMEHMEDVLKQQVIEPSLDQIVEQLLRDVIRGTTNEPM